MLIYVGDLLGGQAEYCTLVVKSRSVQLPEHEQVSSPNSSSSSSQIPRTLENFGEIESNQSSYTPDISVELGITRIMFRWFSPDALEIVWFVTLLVLFLPCPFSFSIRVVLRLVI